LLTGDHTVLLNPPPVRWSCWVGLVFFFPCCSSYWLRLRLLWKWPRCTQERGAYWNSSKSSMCTVLYPLMGCILDERIWLRGNRIPDFSRFFVYADDAYPFALCRALNLFSEKTSWRWVHVVYSLPSTDEQQTC
jgi:hypothetical protein